MRTIAAFKLSIAGLWISRNWSTSQHVRLVTNASSASLYSFVKFMPQFNSAIWGRNENPKLRNCRKTERREE